MVRRAIGAPAPPTPFAWHDQSARLGQAEAAHTRLLQILEEGNEDAIAFRSASRYIVVTADRR